MHQARTLRVLDSQNAAHFARSLCMALGNEKNILPAPDSEWFVPAFIVFWLVISGVLSLMGGWYRLAERFKSDESIDGEQFRFRSGAIGWGMFPVSYGSCLIATVGSKGFALSVLFPFRFLHPRLVIPWSAVERCEHVKFWFMKQGAVHVSGFNRRLVFGGALGTKILDSWTQSRRGS
jgi:hypothetical protein